VAGIVAITVSQPFEVLRSQISLNKIKEPLLIFLRNYMREQGFRGFFIGFLPRLVRKPINSGICWSVL
jgi:solute carrier family 25 protein 38